MCCVMGEKGSVKEVKKGRTVAVVAKHERADRQIVRRCAGNLFSGRVKVHGSEIDVFYCLVIYSDICHRENSVVIIINTDSPHACSKGDFIVSQILIQS